MIKFKIESICHEPWTDKIRSYWRYLGGGYIHVLLGHAKGYVLLVRMVDESTGEQILGILVEEPKKISDFRNVLWHEMGHVVVGTDSDPVMNEFLADKWAIETAISKGFNKISEEIILRCASNIVDGSDEVYVKSAKMIISHFRDEAKRILFKYGSRCRGNSCISLLSI